MLKKYYISNQSRFYWISSNIDHTFKNDIKLKRNQFLQWNVNVLEKKKIIKNNEHFLTNNWMGLKIGFTA